MHFDLEVGQELGKKLMDLRQKVSLGKTGVMVSRMGLASGYGVPAAAIEKASSAVSISQPISPAA